MIHVRTRERDVFQLPAHSGRDLDAAPVRAGVFGWLRTQFQRDHARLPVLNHFHLPLADVVERLLVVGVFGAQRAVGGPGMRHPDRAHTIGVRRPDPDPGPGMQLRLYLLTRHLTREFLNLRVGALLRGGPERLPDVRGMQFQRDRERFVGEQVHLKAVPWLAVAGRTRRAGRPRIYGRRDALAAGVVAVRVPTQLEVGDPAVAQGQPCEQPLRRRAVKRAARQPQPGQIVILVQPPIVLADTGPGELGAHVPVRPAPNASVADHVSPVAVVARCRRAVQLIVAGVGGQHIQRTAHVHDVACTVAAGLRQPFL